MKVVIIIIAAKLLVACAFKEPENKAPSSPDTSRTGPIGAGEPQPEEDLLETRVGKELVSRKLTLSKEATFQTESFITLSDPLENSLSIRLNVKQSQESLSRVDAWLLFQDGRKIALIAEISPEEEAAWINVRVQGLKSTIPDLASTTYTLVLSGFGVREKTFEVSIPIRTPPTALTITQIPFFKVTTLKKIQWNGKRLNLVHIFRVENPNPFPVSLTFPKHPIGEMGQEGKDLSYRDLGCNFTYFASDIYESYSNQLSLLPIDERTLKLAESVLQDKTDDFEISATIEEKQELLIGVFAKNSATDRWQDNGPLLPELMNRVLNTTCRRECTQRECPRDPGREPPPDPNQCPCSQFRSVQEQGLFTVGRNRYGVYLNFAEPLKTFSLRFADQSRTADPGHRMVEVLSRRAIVLWRDENF